MSTTNRKRMRQLARYRTKLMTLFMLYGPPKPQYDLEGVYKFHECVKQINWRPFRAPLLSTYESEYMKLKKHIDAEAANGNR